MEFLEASGAASSWQTMHVVRILIQPTAIECPRPRV